MSGLPDELWRKILEIGVINSGFSFKDLCCISISSRRLRRLSDEDLLWSHLLSSDFPSSSSSSTFPSSSSKTLYKIRLERDRERKKAAHRRAVLRKESQIAENSRRLRELESRLAEEAQKLRTTVAELSNLRKVRQASVALNVWQPEVIRGRQKQVVEQCNVSVDSRSRTLEMELKLCKQQIAIFEKAFKDEKERLDLAKEELVSMKYHPLKDYKCTSGGTNESCIKRRRLKGCNKCNDLTFTWWLNFFFLSSPILPDGLMHLNQELFPPLLFVF